MSRDPGLEAGGKWSGLLRRLAARPAALEPAPAPVPPASSGGFTTIFGAPAQAAPPAPPPPPPPPDAAEPAAPLSAVDISDDILRDLAPRHRGAHYLTPTDLSRAPAVPKRVALVGSCFLQSLNLHNTRPDGCAFDLCITNHLAELPPAPSETLAIGEYDFQIVQIAMRTVLPDQVLWHLPYDDVAAHERVFGECVARLEAQLRAKMRWNAEHGLLSFVVNFLVPQRSLVGILLPRFDVRNPEHFVHMLNERLEQMVAGYANAYVLDADRICASFGRRFIQDDAIATVSHNAAIGLSGRITTRAEPMPPMSAHYELNWPRYLPEAIWAEACAMFRVARQSDAVKLVIVDLDDTLWNGVSGEVSDIDPGMVEGWPIGLAEALMFLRKRGILLAIVSKNEESRIREIWPKIFTRRVQLEDFAAIRINWRAKPDNIREILDTVNLLPRSTVFIDDSPAEREAVAQAFPEMRILGRHPYYLRRILLWSSETQPAGITAESARRSTMVQAQVTRESERTQMSREAFLRNAAPRVRIFRISGVDDPRFARALELINKTNQFNTTGVRRSREELSRFFTEGGRMIAYEAGDTYTDYGLIGVVLMQDPVIAQWVMSCRVLGYDIEQAVLASVVRRMRVRGNAEIAAVLVHTETNFPCRDVFRKAGFAADGEGWRLPPGMTPAAPAHVRVLGGI